MTNKTFDQARSEASEIIRAVQDALAGHTRLAGHMSLYFLMRTIERDVPSLEKLRPVYDAMEAAVALQEAMERRN
jgi:hypothetical protein